MPPRCEQAPFWSVPAAAGAALSVGESGGGGGRGQGLPGLWLLLLSPPPPLSMTGGKYIYTNKYTTVFMIIERIKLCQIKNINDYSARDTKSKLSINKVREREN